MNFYARHIGDYLKDTAHLSLLHHGIYARLMDVYYTREHGFEEGEAHRLIGARSKDERKATDEVLNEFFSWDGNAWGQARCDEEIAGYQHKQELARRSAEARWSASGRNANAKTSGDAEPMRTHSDGNAPNPIPIPSKETSGTVVPAALTAADDRKDAVFALGLPMLTTAGVDEKQARTFLGFLRKHNTDAEVIEGLKRCAVERAVQPIPFLQACLKTSKKHDNRQEAIEKSNRAIGDEWAKESANAA